MSKQIFSATFELFVARYYKNKVDDARNRGIEFKLNLVSVRNLLRTQICPYTGLPLTVPRSNAKSLPTDISIDRIDSKLGYVKGNVMAMSRAANNFKSLFENSNYPMTMEAAEKMLNKVQKKLKKMEIKDDSNA